MPFLPFQFSFILDTIPVILAVIALVKLYQLDVHNITVSLSRISCILLIICQVTWIHSYINHFPLINSLIDNLWTVFNSVVMILILINTSNLKAEANHDRSN